MSRHPFQVGGERWTVGFDPPFESFYAQVEPHPDDVALPEGLTARLLAEQPTGIAAPAAPPVGVRLPGMEVDRVVADARAALTAVLRSFPSPPRSDGQSSAAVQVEGTPPGSAAAPRSACREEGRSR